ncbi:hypothetical protein C5167_029513 [Papaver somniferum]|nr:hypothetical protein C5167_029513 [Papaver somniferum]
MAHLGQDLVDPDVGRDGAWRHNDLVAVVLLMGFSLEVAGGNGYGGWRPTPAKMHNKCLIEVPKETKIFATSSLDHIGVHRELVSQHTSYRFYFRDSIVEPTTFGERIHRMLKLGVSIDEDNTDTRADLEMPELVEHDAKGSKMEEVDESLKL